MSIHVDWLEPDKKTICLSLTATYTWAELFEAIDAAAALLNSIDYPVYVLVDMRQSQHIPPLSLTNLRRLAGAPTMTHANSIAVVMMGARSYVHAMFEVFRRIYPSAAARYRFVRTLDDFNLLRKNEKAQ